MLICLGSIGISAICRLACEQAFHLGDIVKSTRARGDATVGGSRVLARLASLAQIGELARRLFAARCCSFEYCLYKCS